jgi:group I intron endonuclease
VRDRRSGLYEIRNTRNGKVYVGSTVDFHKRWGEHRRALCHGTHGNSYLQRAWDKHGADAFAFAVTAVMPPEQLLDAEDALLASLVGTDRCYNIGRSAIAPHRGRTFTPEQRQRMSEARLRYYETNPDARRLTSESGKGRKLSPEHQAKLLEANAKLFADPAYRLEWGKRRAPSLQTPDARQRQADALRGKPKPEHVRRKIAATLTGRKVGPMRQATREKLRVTLMGHVVTAETRAKLAAAKRGTRWSPEQRARHAETWRLKRCA